MAILTLTFPGITVAQLALLEPGQDSPLVVDRAAK